MKKYRDEIDKLKFEIGDLQGEKVKFDIDTKSL